tara:strand:- start:128 stop:478 length:351 start_codon:yes stop_codon:yes gene_type:complete
MKLIQTNGNKTFKIIPRQFVVGVLTLNLRSESTNVIVSVNATSTIDGNYLSFPAVFGTLVENDFFTLEVLNGSDVIYKDKVFCTDQTINQSNNDYYTINKNQFVSEDSFDNDYIII